MAPLLLLVLLGLFIGTIAWEILERLLQISGINLNLKVGPFGFDLSVLALYIKLNPGSILGAGGGFYLFTTL